MLDLQKDLIDPGYISPTVAQLIFSREADVQEGLLERDAYSLTAYRISLFNFSLMQAYILAKAIDADSSLDELHCPGAIKEIREFWKPREPEGIDGSIEASVREQKNRIRRATALFSRYLSWRTDAPCEFAGEGLHKTLAYLRDVHQKETRLYNGIFPISDETMVELIRAMPLLGATTFDAKRFEYLFDIPGQKTLSIKCVPFLYGWSEEYGNAIPDDNGQFAVLSGVKQGERNGELLLDIALLNNINIRYKTIRCHVAQNEHMLLLCKMLGVSTKWFPEVDYNCPLGVLVNLSSICVTLMEKFWGLEENFHEFEPSNKLGNLRKMFRGTKLETYVNTLRQEEYDYANPNYLNNLFFELYINQGVLRTIRSLFMDSDGKKYSSKLFKLCMEIFVQGGQVQEAARLQLEKECEKKIQSHLEELRKILPGNRTDNFKRRARAIESEQRATCILQIVGLHANNLLTNEEAIRSIEDYFDRIKNPNASLRQDLKEVLSMLTGIYGGLMGSGVPFNEDNFSVEMAKIRQENQSKSAEVLLDDFASCVTRFQGDATDQLVGREIICNEKKLRELSQYVKNGLKMDEFVPTEKIMTRKFVFVSYSHADAQIVREYVNDWQQKGYNLFFDENKFKEGTNWRDAADSALESENCVGVFAFTSEHSVRSEAVSYELTHAYRLSEKRFPADPNSFIVGINISANPNMAQYIEDAVHELKGNEKKYAQKIDEALNPQNRIYKSLPGHVEELSAILHERLTDGTVVSSRGYTKLELAVANFYAFLKLAGQYTHYIGDDAKIDHFFEDTIPNGEDCVFPLVTSVKETKIKRDTIALVGYEIVGRKGESDRKTNYILSSRKLNADDYYCIPNSDRTGPRCSWMVEPLLIRHDLLDHTVEA